MATVAESLFGVSPESLMATREQRLQEQAMQYGRMSPIEAARAGFYEAGSRLGGAIGGLLGAEDPELMRVRQRQQLLQGINPADPASLRAAAQKAMQMGDAQAAQMLTDRALETEGSMAAVGLKRAQEAKTLMGIQREEELRGALGQVAVQELNALQSSVGSLELGQSKAELLKNLEKIDLHYNNWLRTVQGQEPVTSTPATGAKQTIKLKSGKTVVVED